MEHPFNLESFDMVTSIATLHHPPDLDRALSRFAELTAPGGTVTIVGLANSSGPIDILYEIAGVAQNFYYRRHRTVWEHSAPTMTPMHTYSAIRRAAERALPGVQ